MADHRDQVDPVFEFQAPQYIDFANNVDDNTEDNWFDAQKEDVEELKASDLNEDNEDDFGTSDPSFTGSIIIKKKRSMKSTDKRPLKKLRSRKSTHSSSTFSSSSSSSRSTNSNPPHSMELTVPKSPYFATNSTRRLRNVVCETEEEMQCRYMASMMVEQSKRRRLNSFYKKKALYASAGYLPTRSVKPLTEPEDVHFHMDERLRGVPSPQLPEPHAPVIEKTESGLTVPRPFQFQLETRVKPELTQPPKSPYVSFKQKMVEIQKKTPKRFRTLPKNKKLWKISPKPMRKLGITVPHEFSFETEDRSRPSHVLSAEEREALELENIPKFKALPLNERVLHSGGQLGISRAPKQPLTEPKTPKLTTVDRAARYEMYQEEEPQLFKARDFDPAMFKGPIKGVPEFSTKPITIPESPCLVTKSRSVLHPAPAPPKQEAFVFKARPIPIVEPFVPERTEHKVEVQPFALSTEARGVKSKQELREKVRKQKRKERQQRNFKAQPMPISDEPEPSGFVFAPPPTVPQPFSLQSQARGEQHTAKFHHQLQEEERDRKIKANFKANPIIDVAPFQPHRSDKPLTVISDFALNSDSRSSQRQKFEQHKNEKAKAAEEARRLQEEANKREEEKLIKQMRKKLVHKPAPILPSKLIQIQPSTQPLTNPRTPQLRTRQRAHSGRDI